MKVLSPLSVLEVEATSFDMPSLKILSNQVFLKNLITAGFFTVNLTITDES